MLDVFRNDLLAGVAGGGTMGRGIVQVLAQCGVRTLVFDAQPGAAAKARAAIGHVLAKLVEKGRLKQPEVEAALARIEVVDSLSAFAPCHVAIEAIGETSFDVPALFLVVPGDRLAPLLRETEAATDEGVEDALGQQHPEIRNRVCSPPHTIAEAG